MQGAWIEMLGHEKGICEKKSLPVQGAWIEMSQVRKAVARRKSLPVQGAWIEMNTAYSWALCIRRRSPCRERGLKSARRKHQGAAWIVAPRAGSVD